MNRNCWLILMTCTFLGCGTPTETPRPLPTGNGQEELPAEQEKKERPAEQGKGLPAAQKQEVNAYLATVEPKLAQWLMKESASYLKADERKFVDEKFPKLTSQESYERFIDLVTGLFGEGILRKATEKYDGDSTEAAIERLKIEAAHKPLLKALRTHRDITQIRDGDQLGVNLIPELKKELNDQLKGK